MIGLGKYLFGSVPAGGTTYNESGAVTVAIAVSGSETVTLNAAGAAAVTVSVAGSATITAAAGGAVAVDIATAGQATVVLAASGSVSVGVVVSGDATVIPAGEPEPEEQPANVWHGIYSVRRRKPALPPIQRLSLRVSMLGGCQVQARLGRVMSSRARVIGYSGGYASHRGSIASSARCHGMCQVTARLRLSPPRDPEEELQVLAALLMGGVE